MHRRIHALAAVLSSALLACSGPSLPARASTDAAPPLRVGAGELNAGESNTVTAPQESRSADASSLTAGPASAGYAGIEPDAAWRSAAEARIEALRKGELVVRVRQGGQPVAGAELSIEQVKHRFGLGTCAPANVLLDPEAAHFREIVKRYFNIVTLENDLKWVALAGDWGPSFKLEKAQRAVAWLKSEGIAARGHVMVWPGWKELPKALKQHEGQPERLRREVEQRVTEIGTAMKGSLVHWDVVNEPYDNHDLMDIFGDRVMVDWFLLAQKADPGAVLFLNDYEILSGGAGDTSHRQYFDRTIASLLEQGAPLQGIGMQGHFGARLTAPEDLLALLDRYGRFGLPLWVTEYDVVIEDEALAAAFTRDLYTVLFSHAAVHGVVMWGFWDALHWKKNAVMFRQDWSMKPAGQVFVDLFTQHWRTSLQAATDTMGSARVRGFFGDYVVRAKHAGREVSVSARLDPGGSDLVIDLP